jgi:arabinose-5-phosphate isomerase
VLPCVPDTATLHEALLEIPNKRLGMTAVVDAQCARGVLTDGDLKRILLQGGGISRTPCPASCPGRPDHRQGSPDRPGGPARWRRTGGAITSLVVLDGRGRPEGVLHLHDCLDLRAR